MGFRLISVDAVTGLQKNPVMANRIAAEKQTRIRRALVEGSSMRSITRMENCGINTVKRVVVAAGKACIDYHDQHVREVPAQVVQCDEIWALWKATFLAVMPIDPHGLTSLGIVSSVNGSV